MKQKEFNKRYDKYQKNNLPTPFWDNTRETLEYVDYFHRILNSNNKLNVSNNLVEALENITDSGFYYPYISKYFVYKNNNYQLVEGLSHRHSFEEVVRVLYDFPESFKITRDMERYYSKQELDYLKKVQKYLLFIDLKDLSSIKKSITRYRSKKQKKYGSALIRLCDDKTLKNILNNKTNYMVMIPEDISIYKDKEIFDERKELIIDSKYDFKLFIEYTYREVKSYKDIKKGHKNNKLKDNDQVVVEYFNILERY